MQMTNCPLSAWVWWYRTFRSRGLSLPGAKVPSMQRSESLLGTFAPGSESGVENFRSLDYSLPGTFAPTLVSY